MAATTTSTAEQLRNPVSFVEHSGMRFLIFDAPNDDNLPLYLKEWAKYNVTHVVRACEPTYNKETLEKQGIQVHDFAFADGTTPSDEAIDSWLDLVESVFKAPKTPGSTPPVIGTSAKPSSTAPASIGVHCLTEEHQILTDRGFLFLDEILGIINKQQQQQDTTEESGGELKVAGYDHKTKQIVFEQPLEWIIRSHDPQQPLSLIEMSDSSESHRWTTATTTTTTPTTGTPTIRNHDYFEAGHVSVVVTDQHRIYTKRHNNNNNKEEEWHMETAAAMMNDTTTKRFHLLTHAANGRRQQSPLLPLQLTQQEKALQLLGLWWWTQNNNNQTLIQSMTAEQQQASLWIQCDDHEWITATLSALNQTQNIDWITPTNNSGNIIQIINKQWVDALMAIQQAGNHQWVWSLTPSQIKSLLVGASHGVVASSHIITTDSTAFRDDLVQLILFAGYSPFFDFNNSNNQWCVSWTTDDHDEPLIDSSTDIHLLLPTAPDSYKGRTWCVTMPSGFIITRRASADGMKASRPVIIGNCIAGLGRGPILVAIALIQFAGMQPLQAVDFIRSKRRGAINVTQLKFVKSYKPHKRKNSPCIVM